MAKCCFDVVFSFFGKNFGVKRVSKPTCAHGLYESEQPLAPCGILKAVRQGQKFEPIVDKNFEPIENIAPGKKSDAV